MASCVYLIFFFFAIASQSDPECTILQSAAQTIVYLVLAKKPRLRGAIVHQRSVYLELLYTVGIDSEVSVSTVRG